ncbi:hypothetical protein F7725_021312 [Dissostichus mawsoni]|uniref:Uncharacterized protein n=1 Tax=Dissostichus mawsoni TaxID=36200 RepID=A0A7J5YFR1_DISMA|nr:hypothetical protein F7725_021312 [Dissostichus mawsoni]
MQTDEDIPETEFTLLWSMRIVDDMLEILAQIVELPILEEIRSSQAISLEVDETTDVSVSRQLD